MKKISLNYMRCECFIYSDKGAVSSYLLSGWPKAVYLAYINQGDIYQHQTQALFWVKCFCIEGIILTDT